MRVLPKTVGVHMKRARIVGIFMAFIALATAALAEGPPPSFMPQVASTIGTAKANTPIAYTQVVTQLAGELSIAVTDEHFMNLVPNWPKFVKALLTERRPVIAYTTVIWADQVLRVTCWIDRANSDLPRRRFRVVMEVTDGTVGSVPVGSVFAISDGRLLLQSGMIAFDNRVVTTPGVLPDVLPTSLTLITQLVPDLWETGEPGRVTGVYTLTSVNPPDGSAPLVSTVREGFPIQ